MKKDYQELMRGLLKDPENLSDRQIAVVTTLAMVSSMEKENRGKTVRLFVILGIVLIPLIYFLVATSWWQRMTREPVLSNYVSLVRVSGEIGPGTRSSIKALRQPLQKAFADKKAKGVIISINSPGGTPVQSSGIYHLIMQLKKKYGKKVIVIGEDVMASGAFMIAVSGDELYVNESTMTGSIGVVMSGFDFSGLAKKYGIKRRILTAGIYKRRMDPFLEMNSESRDKIQELLSSIHSHFISIVKARRGRKLKGDEKQLFSGDVWTGKKAVDLGLVDGIGDLNFVLQHRFKAHTYKDYSRAPSLYSRLVNKFGANILNNGVRLLTIMPTEYIIR